MRERESNNFKAMALKAEFGDRSLERVVPAWAGDWEGLRSGVDRPNGGTPTRGARTKRRAGETGSALR